MLINNYKNEKFIKWIVNDNCNYNCSYCFEKDFHKKDINIDSIIKTAYKVKEFIDKNNLTSIILLGGELFLLDEEVIFEILNILKNKNLNLYIITNFSKENFIEYDSGCDGKDCYKMYFVTKDINISDITIQQEELSEVKWFTMNELKDMVNSGELNEDQIACFNKVCDYLNNN